MKSGTTLTTVLVDRFESLTLQQRENVCVKKVVQRQLPLGAMATKFLNKISY